MPYSSFQVKDEVKYEHVSPKVTSTQDGVRSQDDDQILCLVDDLKEVQVHIQVKLKGTSSSLKSKDHYAYHKYFIHSTDIDYKIKKSLDEPLTNLELKPLPDHLEYAFLEEPSFLPVIISSQLSEQNKNKLIFVLKRQAFAWKTTDTRVLSKTVVYTNQSALRHLFKKQDAKPHLIRWILLLQEFNIEIKDKKGTKNVAADHLSRIENDETSEDGEIDDNFSCETLMEIITKDIPWFTDFANYLFASARHVKKLEIVAGLRIAEQMGIENLVAKVDSRLMANQINGSYEAKEQSMIQYLENAKALISNFKIFSIEQKSIEEREVLAIVEEKGYCWMTPLIEYLAEGTLPAETKRAREIKIKERHQAEYVVKEIHEGSCIMHSGPRSVVAKAIRSRYYWPAMHKDARNIIRKCDDCQTHWPVPKNPQQKLTPITSPWPFYKWEIDISGPFSEAQGKVKFLNIHFQIKILTFRGMFLSQTVDGAKEERIFESIMHRASFIEKVPSVPNNHTQISSTSLISVELISKSMSSKSTKFRAPRLGLDQFQLHWP
ncbi:reverse transcriptase domain-containing protein [Tanacetum coccineum]